MVDPLGGPAYWWPLVAAFLVGYLAGSVPFGVLFTRMAGAGDLRRIGSGNIGATNVLRTGRRGLAVATLVADLLKGAVPTALAFAWYGPDMAILTGVGTVIGHCFPVWLRFRGGKGVATAAGVILALTPTLLLGVLVVFVLVVAISRYVSLGSITAAFAAPLLAYLTGYLQAAELYFILAALIFFRHLDNVRRLITGRENRLELGSRKES
ncbi:MAG TPA: glycerol-3-phosphate 1-O-acyltransferase [Rhodospirillales bacterium]|nr:glycerol-3-phosphate 1-O-acyltransferase [Rhodospirillales bacterium]